MDPPNYEDLKARFLKLYANVPTPLRDEIIAVVGDETFTWASAKVEIQHDGDPKHKKNSEGILKQLLDIGVLKDDRV